MSNTPHIKTLLLLALVLLICFFISISLGSVSIPISDVFKSLSGGDLEKSSWDFIIQNYRLPKTITAMLVGSGLGVSGLLMQTLFKNPLAGPFVLGISSGASLGVALLILGGTSLGIASAVLASHWSTTIAAGLGSLLVLALVISVATRVKDTMALLIIGLMVGSITGAVVSILSYFSKAEELQQYIFWSFGSLGDNSWEGLGVLGLCWFLGILLAIFTIKPLNALLLGDAYAQSIGIYIQRSRLLIVIATSLLAGSITAFAGPIAFIGLAIPHIVRQVIKTSQHAILIPAVMLTGAIVMLICDAIAQLPGSAYTLPINAITSIIGAPVVIWLLIRKKKLIF